MKGHLVRILVYAQVIMQVCPPELWVDVCSLSVDFFSVLSFLKPKVRLDEKIPKVTVNLSGM